MKATVIAGGMINNYSIIKNLIDENQYIICADSGYDHAFKMDISPDLIVGDMDSVKNDISKANRIVYSKFKDYTDTELAINAAMRLKYNDISLYAVLGDRIDHSLGNIFLLKQFLDKNIKLTIYNEQCGIHLIDKTFNTILNKGSTVSLIPLEDSFNISTSGLYFPLKKENLMLGSCRGISNIADKNEIKIEFNKGKLIVIISNN